MTTHADHRFSITIHTDDLAVVNCLRALSKYSQKTGNNNIPWGGTKDCAWRSSGREVTFYFSESCYREGFLAEISRLLPDNLWREVGRDDSTPAQRAR